MLEKLFGRNREDKKEETQEVTAVIEKQEVKEVKEVINPEIIPSSTEVKNAMRQEAAQQDEQIETRLTYKEMKALKRSRYETNIMNNSKFKKAYVIQNIKTGQVAEIRAASSFHACNIIGWKVNKVILISEKEIQEAQEIKNT